MNNQEKYFTTKEVAERYKISVETLEVWRSQSTKNGALIGPKPTKLERCVRYKESDLLDWEAKNNPNN